MAKLAGLQTGTIHHRLKKGWSPEEAVKPADVAPDVSGNALARDLAAKSGLHFSTVRARISRGWTIERILAQAVRVARDIPFGPLEGTRLTVIRGCGNGRYACVCACGTHLEVLGASLKGGNTTSCGCAKADLSRARSIAKAEDLTEKWFGDPGAPFQVIGVSANTKINKSTGKGTRLWRCRCPCGSEFEARADVIRRGRITSCGCKTLEPSLAATRDRATKLVVDGEELTLSEVGARVGISPYTVRQRLGRGLSLEGVLAPRIDRRKADAAASAEVTIERPEGLAEVLDLVRIERDEGLDGVLALLRATSFAPAPAPAPRAKTAPPPPPPAHRPEPGPEVHDAGPDDAPPPPATSRGRPRRAASAEKDTDTSGSNRRILDLYGADLKRHPLLGSSEHRDLARAYVAADVEHWCAIFALQRAAVPAIEAILVCHKGCKADPAQADEGEIDGPGDGEEEATPRRSGSTAGLAEAKLQELLGLARQPASADRPRYDALAREIAGALRQPDGQRAWLAQAVKAARAKLQGDTSVEATAYLDRVRETDRARVRTRNSLINVNLRLAWWWARKVQKKGSLALEDYIQEANLGLMKAADRFDPERGFTFPTYATWWIRQSLSRAFDDHGNTIRLPVHIAATSRTVKTAESRLRVRTGVDPSIEAIAEATNLTPEKIRRVQDLPRARSLDAPVGGDSAGEEVSLLDFVPDQTVPSPADLFAREHEGARLRAALKQLAPKEAHVLRLRFAIGEDATDPRTLDEVSLHFGLTRERIRQIEAKALNRLYTILRCGELRTKAVKRAILPALPAERPVVRREVIMSEGGRDKLTATFTSNASATRNARVLEVLRDGPQTNADVAKKLDMPRPDVSKALQRLQHVGKIWIHDHVSDPSQPRKPMPRWSVGAPQRSEEVAQIKHLDVDAPVVTVHSAARSLGDQEKAASIPSSAKKASPSARARREAKAAGQAGPETETSARGSRRGASLQGSAG